MDLDALIALALHHAAATEDVVAQAVDLYSDAVMRDPHADRQAVASEIESLVPAVTQLVAQHFSQTLVKRAATVLAELESVDETAKPEPALPEAVIQDSGR